MQEALAELEDASTRVYYDADNDAEDRQSYYHELHRNMTVYKMQGNRNPFIDFQEWAKLIDFTQGLGD